MFINNQTMHCYLAVYYFILPLLHVSTRVCHHRGTLPCLHSYMRIECDGWWDSALNVLICLLCGGLVCIDLSVTLPSVYALGNVTDRWRTRDETCGSDKKTAKKSVHLLVTYKQVFQCYLCICACIIEVSIPFRLFSPNLFSLSSRWFKET
jgi:hypothetical protein